MGEYTLVKPKIYDIIKASSLVDERGIAALTKAMLKQSPRETAGQILKTTVKTIATAALSGIYSTSTPMDYVVTLKGESLYLIQAPRRGMFVALPSVKQYEIDSRIEIKKEEIVKMYAKKVLGGSKLNLELTDGYTVVLDVTGKTAPAFYEIVKSLGFPDCKF